MARLRHFPFAYRRWLLLLVVAALFARGLAPEGWMPVASAHGVTIGLCSGTGPEMAMPMAMPGSKQGGAPMHHHAPDHPCAFAAAAAAATLDLPALLVLPAPAHPLPLPVWLAVAVGRGLAAPPPPPTGPPIFA